jgi:branched-chain amino acid transport system permease protein
MSFKISDVFRQRNIWIVLTVLFLAFLVVFPGITSGYWIRVLTSVFMYVGLASSLNIIMGYTGYTDFGNVVFFGVGAYVTGILMNTFKMPIYVSVLIGAVVCSIYAALLGLPLLRLRGHYFSIATIGVMDATREIVTNLKITGGGQGMSFPIPDLNPQVFNSTMYFVMLGLACLFVLASWFIRRSRFGFGLRAIRAEEQAANISGIPTTQYKVRAWMISAFMTGLMGGVFGFWFSYVEPQDVFNITISLKYMIMMLIGGAGTVIGPIIGAFFMEVISELVWGQFIELHMGILALIVILTVVFVPKGILYYIQNRINLKGILAEIRQNRI